MNWITFYDGSPYQTVGIVDDNGHLTHWWECTQQQVEPTVFKITKWKAHEAQQEQQVVVEKKNKKKSGTKKKRGEEKSLLSYYF
jgi:hypothetical protein